MAEIKKFTVRACPLCRVAMLHSDSGWKCPQCGSAIIEPAKGEPTPREPAPEAFARAADTLRS
jgi:ribosomal protein L37AE/L43A